MHSRRTFLRALAGVVALPFPFRFFAPVAATQCARADRSAFDAESAMRGNVLWYRHPAPPGRLLFEGLPLGNGRLGALVGGDPGRERIDLTEGSLWQGNRNSELMANGQFPYIWAGDSAGQRLPDGRFPPPYPANPFGSFQLLAKLGLAVPAHAPAAVRNYRRELDLGQAVARVVYDLDGVRYRREAFVSHPDRVLVLHLSQSGGGAYSGRLTLDGTHGEATHGGENVARVQFAGQFDNGLRYAATAQACHDGGRVAERSGALVFDGCREVTVLVAAATNYAPHIAHAFMDAAERPLRVAEARIEAAARHTAQRLLQRHVADHRALFNRLEIDLGTASPAQRKLDTAARLRARVRTGKPDPELEAAYLQFGRYLAIAGSHGGLPTNLQGLWLTGNHPPWNADYHTDVNLEMNYWLPDRAGLGACFEPLADYCLAQLPAWAANTRRWFNDPRNPFRNTSGRLAGWTVAISENIFGGNGSKWNPAGNAWLCDNLWHHYAYTQDRAYLARVFPLLKGACEFWQARLIETTVIDPETGARRNVLIDDHDWSPEQGPDNTRGITYAQELVWDLFGNFVQACRVLDRDADYARTIGALQQRLYLPRVSPLTGWLEEWMTPKDLGSPTHRHLSPLIGLFPGDRIVVGKSPAALIEGARRLLIARGMHSFGWGNAWRALCWARLKDGERAYQLLLNNLAPSDGRTNGTAPNLFDVYALGKQGIFQIDANFGTPAAMLEMLLYSRPGYIELLPALPRAWPRGHVSGIGARGGFIVDLAWDRGRATTVTLHSVGGTATDVAYGKWKARVELEPGSSSTLHVSGGDTRRVSTAQ
ncbi:MAG TPA: glycoside hydrolase family 95 protein [Rhodanobacteraceae bacterium]